MLGVCYLNIPGTKGEHGGISGRKRAVFAELGLGGSSKGQGDERNIGNKRVLPSQCILGFGMDDFLIKNINAFVRARPAKLLSTRDCPPRV